MTYTQLPDGRWQRVIEQPKPESVSIYYMRDNLTFLVLPLNVEEAMTTLRIEFNKGQTYGMLVGHPMEVIQENVHAGSSLEWPAFESAARPWLERAVELSQPPTP